MSRFEQLEVAVEGLSFEEQDRVEQAAIGQRLTLRVFPEVDSVEAVRGCVTTGVMSMPVFGEAY
jgi:hypothetical protein